ncbi:unnamed protein product [Orchesella dallaii]|uniref:Secreted protein n=1 Tax=Orchesella dallaii TaxID=48710 RepID=A0ABP1R7M9_9HEXA
MQWKRIVSLSLLLVFLFRYFSWFRPQLTSFRVTRFLSLEFYPPATSPLASREGKAELLTSTSIAAREGYLPTSTIAAREGHLPTSTGAAREGNLPTFHYCRSGRKSANFHWCRSGRKSANPPLLPIGKRIISNSYNT